MRLPEDENRLPLKEGIMLIGCVEALRGRLYIIEAPPY